MSQSTLSEPHIYEPQKSAKCQGFHVPDLRGSTYDATIPAAIEGLWIRR